MFTSSAFPKVNVGDEVLVNAAIVGETDLQWRPAIVTKIAGESIDATVFIQESTIVKIDPRTNLRWHQDPKLHDPLFTSTFANDEDAGVFKFTKTAEQHLQAIELIGTALEALASGDKGNKEQVKAIADQLRSIREPEESQDEHTAPMSGDWRLRAAKGEQKPDERAAILAGAQ